MFGAIKKALLKLARAVLDDVISQINSLITDQLVGMVQEPIQQMIDQLGPDVWTGWGADAFANDCTSLHIPQTTGIQESCNVIISRIQRATEIMDGADVQCRGLVDNLNGTFGSILKL